MSISPNPDAAVVVHFPHFPIDSGEQDASIYEARFAYMIDMLTNMLPPGHYFFHDTPVTWAQLRRTVHSCPKCKSCPVHILSTVLDEPNVTLKSQIHRVLESNHPFWYDATLADRLNSYVAFGFTAFSIDELSRCLTIMLERFDTVRIKSGWGSAGEEQWVVASSDAAAAMWNTNDEIETKLIKYGMVLEKNIASSSSYSFTLFEFLGNRFVSVGQILETNDGGTENRYSGTTCMILMAHDSPPLGGLHVSDPAFGDIFLDVATMRTLINFGLAVAAVYREFLPCSVLTRINLDVMFDERRPVLVDASLRVGGNTWSELRGAHRILNQRSNCAVENVRIVDRKTKATYDDVFGEESHKLHIMCDSSDEDRVILGWDC